MARSFSDWVTGYLEYTQGITCPDIFREWSAVSAVAAALERKVYTRIERQPCYANLYILLVGPPGVGKTNAIRHARELVKAIPKLRVTPHRITQRQFYNSVESAVQTIVHSPTSMEQHCSLSALINEFSVFVRPSAIEFMDDLTDIFDCPDPFDYSTATQGEVLAPKSWFNLIGGTTTGYLKDAWTKAVLDKGFPARFILVWHGQRPKTNLHPVMDDDQNAEEERLDEKTKGYLVADLDEISNIRGRFTWSREAAKMLVEWHESGMNPVPMDPRLEHYRNRRLIHLTKLCIVKSAAKRNDQEINSEDFKEAMRLLIETEKNMGQALEPLGANPIRDAMVMVRRFVRAQHKRTGEGVPEHKIRNLLINEVHPQAVPHLLNEISHAQWCMTVGDPPARKFFPAGELKEVEEH